MLVTWPFSRHLFPAADSSAGDRPVALQRCSGGQLPVSRGSAVSTNQHLLRAPNSPGRRQMGAPLSPRAPTIGPQPPTVGRRRVSAPGPGK